MNFNVIKNTIKDGLVIGGLVTLVNGCSLGVPKIPIDVNMDGKTEFVEYNFNPFKFLGSHDIYVVTDTTRSKVLSIQDRPQALNAIDFDGDNIPDLSYMLLNQSGFGSLDRYFAKGNGDGTFQTPTIRENYRLK